MKMPLGRPFLRTPLEEVLELPAALVASKGEDLVSASHTPVHRGVLETSCEDHFATGLDDVTGGA